MTKRAILSCGFCGVLSISCSGPGSAPGPSATNAASLAIAPHAAAGQTSSTWTVITNANPTGGGGVSTTVTIGQDSLNVTSPDFTLTANRTGNVLAFVDNDPPSLPANAGALNATQTASAFNAGILPFNLGGSWTMQAGPKGASPTVSCTLTVSASEIDGACQFLAPTAGPWFHFTTQKMSAAASSLGDFGGHWLNTWTTAAGTGAGTFPCTIDFVGNDITTCTGQGVMSGAPVGNPLSGITFTYDGANTVSGAAMGWAEYTATR
jgi:hypothetical protein